MHVLAAAAFSAVVLAAPLFAGADPAQAQAAQSAASATAPAAAATGSATTAPPVAVQETVKVTAPPSTDSLDEIVCKTSPPQTGTRLGGSRECHTVRDWKERQQQSQDMLAHSQTLGMGQPLRTK